MYGSIVMQSVESDKEYLVALRRYFHMHPELSRQEFNTASRIEEELEKAGLSHVRVGETGVASEIKGAKGPGKTIVLRADTDALPVTEEENRPYRSLNAGVMHACGHDVHTTALIGAARFLSSHRSLFGGTVRLNFQQAEEIGYGGRLFVDGSYLDGASRTFGCHTDPAIQIGKVSLTPGPNNASVDFFRIKVNGKSAHVSSPQLGVDALYTASHIVVALQAAVTRLSSPTDPLLIGIGKLNAGTAYNIVAEKAEMEGTVRAMRPETRAKAKSDIERISADIAHSYGADVQIEWNDFTSPLINDSKAAEEAGKVACSLFGKENVITNRPYALTGDDFAEYIIKVPGVYAYVGSGNDSLPDTRSAQHNCRFDVDENSIIIMAELYASYALSYLNDFEGL